MQLTIAPAREEILWRDGSALGIHQVLRDGVPERYLRAVPGPNTQPIVVDLRPVVPGLDQDLARLPARDWPGLVFFSLRHRFCSAFHFQAEALARGRVDVLELQHREAA